MGRASVRDVAVSALPRVGRYRCIAELGGGAAGMVYLAENEGALRKLAIVRIADLPEDDDRAVEAFVRRARLAARINHPNVAQTTEVGVDPTCARRPFVVSEFLDGQTLASMRTRMQRTERMSALGLVRVLVAVLDALDFAHELSDFDGTSLRIRHGRVSPSNVFVTYEGWVKLLDFGALATPCPSPFADDHDPRGDLFGVGVMLVEGLAGARLFGDAPRDEVVARLRTKRYPRSARELGGDVPTELDDVCRRALAPADEDPFSSARELRHALLSATTTAGSSLPPRRELGAQIVEAFAEERRRLHARIEAATARSDGNSARPASTPSDDRGRRRRFDSLEELSSALRLQLGEGAVFNSVNTRLILQVGVNLKKCTASQNGDPLVIDRVLEALAKMGFRVGSEVVQ
jgi:serine/threonine-protein kinase